jgi:TATA-box binding protein (TBP) (component of TFIID and TFIIIB)
VVNTSNMENLRISVITVCSELNTPIDLHNCIRMLDVDDQIKYIENGEETKGVSQKKIRKQRNPQKKKVFYNQTTIHYMHSKVVNIKLFNNGKIQMTGLKYEDQGKEILSELIQKIKSVDEKNEQKIFLKQDVEYDFSNYRVVMINSDFDIGMKINRENLHQELISTNMYSSFEPCIYPGVNIKYFYNSCHKGGVCNCERICNGKGEGNGDGNCKRVTIAVFKSGKIIITAGMNKEQLQICYEYINDFINERKDKIEFKKDDNSIKL